MARRMKSSSRRKRPAAPRSRTQMHAAPRAKTRSRPKPQMRPAPDVAAVSAPSAGSLTHINQRGEARMVDVGNKGATERIAVAEGCVIMRADTLDLVLAGNAMKGDVLGAARLAGIMAAKRTHGLIPLCHPLPITKVDVEINPEHSLPGFLVQATVKVTAKTGVEMEALTAVSIACLTIYDMVKAVERGMRIEGIRLLRKSGGKSGEWLAGA